MNNTGINYTEKQAYTVPDVAKNYNVPREAWYTNKLNRFLYHILEDIKFIAQTGTKVFL